MKVAETSLPGVLLVEPEVYRDARGHFVETFRADRYAEAGMPGPFVQDNVSFSRRGVLRGLHLQNPNAQAKLVTALEGEIFDVAVDVRVGSPHFGRWTGARLSADAGHQIYIPAGFAHGFCVLSDAARVGYKCDALYHPGSEMTVLWSDPEIGIDWPVAAPVLSKKDAAAARLADIPRARLPVYPGGGR